MSTLREDLNNLKMSDTFSLIFFVLYKLKDIKEYSTISELAYILDKDSLLSLCEYFGGLTIKIPSINELKDIVDALLLYQYIDIDGMDYAAAIEKIGFQSHQLRHIKTIYTDIKSILKEYKFNVW